MRILIVSWYFPPANDVAALRVGKLAEYLESAGHEVWVLTGDRQHADKSLPVPVPEQRILRTRWRDVNALRLPGRRRKASATSAPAPAKTEAGDPQEAQRPGLKARLTRFYLNLAQIPDRQIGWLPYLLRAGKELLARRSFDLIYASGPPFTAFLAARNLSRRFHVPWVAEYRDGWSRYVYVPKPAWRQAIDERIENSVTPRASGIVTVSEPWAEFYRDRFRLPTLAVYNGFDEDSLLPPPSEKPHGAPLRIVYMGALYGGLRDPSLLYDAVKRSGLSPADVQICYYGPKPSDIAPLAEKFGVSDFVVLHDRVPYRVSLEIQRASDVLLLLQSPLDPRNVPAKIFEYLASRRPIIGLGLDDGIPARLIRERNAGIDVSDADTLAMQLRLWAAEKKEKGFFADLPASVHEGLSRHEQFARLETFLRGIANAKAP